MTIATVREAIHERLDPVIEEIVSREVSQRGAGYGYAPEQTPFQALMPVLLSTILQGRQAGAQPQPILQNLLPVLPVLIQSLTRRPAGLQQQQLLQNLLPVLPAILPLLMQPRPGQQPQQLLQNLLPVLPALLPLLMQQQQQGPLGQQPQQALQTLAPALVAALSAAC